MTSWPRLLDGLDRILGADPEGTTGGALGCYEPRLQADGVAVVGGRGVVCDARTGRPLLASPGGDQP